MSRLMSLSMIGMQFSHDLSNLDHLNKEYWFRTSLATHSYPALAGQLPFAISSRGSSLTSVIVSIGILPVPTFWPPLPPSDRLLPSPLNRSLPLPEKDNDTLSLELDIPFLTVRWRQIQRTYWTTLKHTNNYSQISCKWTNVNKLSTTTVLIINNLNHNNFSRQKHQSHEA